MSCPRTLSREKKKKKKKQKPSIQCGSNPGPLDYESDTSPLSHAGTSGNDTMVTAFDSFSDYTNSKDEKYNPGEESDYSSDDYLPFSTFRVSKEQALNQKTNYFQTGSAVADLENYEIVNDNCQAEKDKTTDPVNQFACCSSNVTQQTLSTLSKTAECSVVNRASRKHKRKSNPEA